jgi:hypothetical protein
MVGECEAPMPPTMRAMKCLLSERVFAMGRDRIEVQLFEQYCD